MLLGLRKNAECVLTLTLTLGGIHLAVTDTVHHLVVFTVEGVCQEAQALQENSD